ncbi:Uu.00g105210.m01.CDS01 [Anthostomella pinea]|uniref:Uu.00g105210.m01.CDS01 n=1 Tax=Anthostomella pinea TaxID=933095 RepID=A0AAI8VEX2_9PEZI|nr:Uu.00g105210.m01.CDS01 [Anthostomella pinea]
MPPRRATSTACAQPVDASSSSSHLQGRSGNASKRKHDSTENPDDDAGPRPKKIQPSTSADTTSDVPGQSSGSLDDIAFEGEMRFEVISGPTGGGIRLHGPRGLWGMDAAFSLSFASIEAIIVMKNLKSSARKKEAYEIFIVPSAATGIAPIKNRYPQLISFKFPNQKVDGELRGAAARAGDAKKDTYLSVCKKVLDEQLMPFGKAVTDYTETAGVITQVEASLEPVSGTDLKKKSKGHVHFLDTGILFLSKEARVLVPFSLMTGLNVIFGLESRKLMGMDVILKVSVPADPASKDVFARLDYALLAFKRLSPALTKHIKAYAEKHTVKVEWLSMEYYDYAKDSPMSGWMDAPEDLVTRLCQPPRQA